MIISNFIEIRRTCYIESSDKQYLYFNRNDCLSKSISNTKCTEVMFFSYIRIIIRSTSKQTKTKTNNRCQKTISFVLIIKVNRVIRACCNKFYFGGFWINTNLSTICFKIIFYRFISYLFWFSFGVDRHKFRPEWKRKFDFTLNGKLTNTFPLL